MPPSDVNVIITMAGNGERFRRAGYDQPKFKIEVRGRTLFHWAVSSLANLIGPESQVIFAVRPEHEPEDFIRREASLLGIADYDLAFIEQLTDGQATTALIAGDSLRSKSDPVLIYNIDTYVEPQFLASPPTGSAGWIPCFPGEGDAWSFARIGPDGLVCEVTEKRRISPHASIGLYWFRSFDLFQRIYRRQWPSDASAANGSGERYIAPLYNLICGEPGGVHLSVLPESAVHPLGTPAEVELFRC